MKKTINYSEQYDDIQQFLAEDNLDDARLKLETLVKPSSDPELRRMLGILEILTGYPHLAAARWEGLTEEQLRFPESTVQELKETLPVYEDFFGKYNKAIELMQEEKLQEAMKQWDELFARAHGYPLPVTFYRGYYFLLLLSGRTENVYKQIEAAPVYVQESSTMRMLHDRIASLEAAGLKKRKKGWTIAACSFAGLLAATVITGLTLKPVESVRTMNAAGTPVTAPAPVVEGQYTASTELKQKDEQLQRLESEKSKLDRELQMAKAASAKLENLESMLNSAGIDPKKLQEQAALSDYRRGMAYFAKKAYEQAFTAFKESLKYSRTGYYSDDAMYSMVQALKALGRNQEAIAYIDEFITEQSDSFVHSPYRDDLMLQKAVNYVQAERLVDAKDLLEQIKTMYPKEWTAQEASRILQKLE
jgi:TolA-binding protein/L-amino acid N-acyltransferase YncA